MPEDKHHPDKDDGVTHDDAIHGSEAITQDVNTDERLSVGGADFRDMANMNMKRTYDLHQTLDTDAILAARTAANEEREMRLRHAEELQKQALRHADENHVVALQTLQAGSVGTSRIVEQIASDTGDRIVSYVKRHISTT